jgi:TPR repeat protein
LLALAYFSYKQSTVTLLMLKLIALLALLSFTASSRSENVEIAKTVYKKMLTELYDVKSGKTSLSDFLALECFEKNTETYLHNFLMNRVKGAYLKETNDENFCFLYNLSKLNFYVFELEENKKDSLWLVNALKSMPENNDYITLEQAIISFLNDNYDDSVATLFELSKRGIQEATYYIAVMYANGLGLIEDSAKSHEYLKLSSDEGHYQSKYDLVRRISSKKPTTKTDYLVPLIELVEKIHFDSVIYYSILKFTGNEIERDIAGGITMLESLPKDPFGKAEYYLGLGNLIIGNEDEGIKFLKSSANKGHQLAVSYLEELEG